MKGQKGITLVALVITIIVLLILAIVTIAAVNSDRIVNHAQNAVNSYGAAQNEEAGVINNAANLMDDIAAKIQ